MSDDRHTIAREAFIEALTRPNHDGEVFSREVAVRMADAVQAYLDSIGRGVHTATVWEDVSRNRAVPISFNVKPPKSPKHNHMTKAELIHALETGVSQTVYVKRKKWHHAHDERFLVGYLDTSNAKPIQISVINGMVASGQLKWVNTFSGNGRIGQWRKEYRYVKE